MANDAKVSDAYAVAQAMAHGVPMTGVDMTLCNMVNSAIWKAYPWRAALTVLASPVTLTDGNQDFATGVTNIYRMTQFWLTRTDTTPDQVRNISVAKNLAADLVPVSAYSIRSAAVQPGLTNKFRLEAAVRIASGEVWTIGGEYQPHPTALADVNDPFWFSDEHVEVFAHGLAYWAYKLADDKRAGDAIKIGNGRVQYTGQLAQFRDAIEQMAADEDFGDIEGYYPSETMGSDGRNSGDFILF
jgi:hypothetical protein